MAKVPFNLNELRAPARARGMRQGSGSVRSAGQGIQRAEPGVFGLAFGPRKAKACSCDGWDNWSLTVESVTSGDNVDHSAAWPTSAKINDLPRQVDFWATSGTGDGVTHVQVYR